MKCQVEDCDRDARDGECVFTSILQLMTINETGEKKTENISFQIKICEEHLSQYRKLKIVRCKRIGLKVL